MTLVLAVPPTAPGRKFALGTGFAKQSFGKLPRISENITLNWLLAETWAPIRSVAVNGANSPNSCLLLPNING